MNPNGVIVIGTGGMLGRELLAACRRRDSNVRAIEGRHVVDITSEAAVKRMLTANRPRMVINAAAYTDVDGAESNHEAADRVNRLGAFNLALGCKEIGALLVHYSTDHVFDGDSKRPYRADTTPDPVNAYGRSKLAGEQAIAEIACRHLIIRTSWLFSPHCRNFVRTVLDLAGQRPALEVVNDQHGRPTHAADLAETTFQLLDRDARGIFHAANAGSCTRFQLASAIVERAGIACTIEPCRTGAVTRLARRPRFGVLDLDDTVALVGEPRHWTAALDECVEYMTSHRARQLRPGAVCGSAQ